MYRCGKKNKTLGIFIIFTLLILTSMSVFPSPALALDEQWDYPGLYPIILPQLSTWEYPVVPNLYEVNKVILEVNMEQVILIDFIIIELEVGPSTYESIALSYYGSWSSLIHTVLHPY